MLLDVQKEQRVGIVEGDGHLPTEVALSPDASRLASGSEDGYLQVWDLAGRRLAATSKVYQPGGLRFPHAVCFWTIDPSTILVTGMHRLFAVGPQGKMRISKLAHDVSPVLSFGMDSAGRTVFYLFRGRLCPP